MTTYFYILISILMDLLKHSSVFIILIGVIAGQSIITSPKDTTGTLGGTAHFVCEVDYEEHIPTVTWRCNDKIIYFYMDDQVDYPLGKNKYVVSNSHAVFTLEVRNLNYMDGGDYTCEVIGQKKSAALIVLGQPVITQETTHLMEGKTAKFTCKARFGGPSIDKILPDQHPQMKLFRDDVIYQGKSFLQDNFLIQKVYEIPIDDSMESKDLKCEIGTPLSKNLTSSATLIVHYSVRNVTYAPHEETYVSGRNITCSARGYPIPLFEWRNRAKPDMVIKGQLLHITDDMEGKNSWTCTARNSVGGQMYEDEITAKFEAASTIDGEDLCDKAPLSLVILVNLLITFGFLAAGSLCFIAIKRVKTTRGNRAQKRNVTTPEEHQNWLENTNIGSGSGIIRESDDL